MCGSQGVVEEEDLTPDTVFFAVGAVLSMILEGGENDTTSRRGQWKAITLATPVH